MLGATAALTLASGWGGRPLRRWLLIAATATAAAGVLVLRGVLGVTLLAASRLQGPPEEAPPAILVAVEP